MAQTTMASSRDFTPKPARLYVATPPFFRRILVMPLIYIFKPVLQLVIKWHFSGKEHAKYKPTYTKVYPVRPMIKNRIWIPESYKAGDKALPLHINMHGGGFCIGEPAMDDEVCSWVASRGICVVSVGYRLAPLHPFPTPVYDAAEIIKAVLADEELPYDKKFVSIGGSSAGANLASCVVQLPGIQGKVRGLFGLYPVVDLTQDIDYKISQRPFYEGEVDGLTISGPWFNWCYLPATEKLTNPLLSPIYAKREDLPPKIFYVGCERDILCDESWRMIENLCAQETAAAKEDLLMSGREGELPKRVILLPEGQVDINGEPLSWQQGGIKWKKLMGMIHGFDQMAMKGKDAAETEKKEKSRLQYKKETYSGIADWIWAEVVPNA